MKLLRIETATLQERVYRELAAALMQGRFLPGEVVTARSLAGELGTSPMPVRESILRLIAQGALELLPNRTVRVAVLDEGRFDELWRIRALLEGEAAADAARRVTAAELDEIRAANAAYGRQLAEGDEMAALEANQRFHFAIYRAARADLLMRLIEGLWLQSGPYLSAPGREPIGADVPAIRGTVLGNHAAIVAALGAGDAAAARAAVRADLLDFKDWCKRYGRFARTS